MVSVDRERRNWRKGSLGYYEVFVLLDRLDFAAIIFAKGAPSLVTQSVLKTISRLMLFYFLPLVFSSSEKSCSTQPPMMQKNKPLLRSQGSFCLVLLPILIENYHYSLDTNFHFIFLDLLKGQHSNLTNSVISCLPQKEFTGFSNFFLLSQDNHWVICPDEYNIRGPCPIIGKKIKTVFY